MAYYLSMLIWMIAAWKWVDWRQWRKYQATILYFLLGDIAYCYITRDYPLWRHVPVPTFTSETGAELAPLVVYASTLLIYLTRFPRGRWKAVAWTALFVGMYVVAETVLHYIGVMQYDHGWRWLYSVLFSAMMIPMMRLHSQHPLICYLLSAPIPVFLIIVFKVPM
ncbi:MULTISPECIES: CBO0543 family protein [Alicyclobacillus]|uniref:Uncharacterized protein n=1 Tax=Alicyclobacillus acidoterrestris (strain ATCC 49025 / DSM 3922 / CIP 106132 / NCIMB 13137 / GD3B) TaxID=1356854 RepID=T0CEI1_ALIAG|nr:MULTISPECIES: CBO0543 family protein [Alicyclobacillus]EPZ50905.1 hypothetical protein N007_20995 [Alicyclobacillus acidoterrestris ATCC 49025]UNO49006.1 hypothetical protein K1I37_00055 [Alicyclobacillus acidoterrestris]